MKKILLISVLFCLSLFANNTNNIDLNSNIKLDKITLNKTKDSNLRLLVDKKDLDKKENLSEDDSDKEEIKYKSDKFMLSKNKLKESSELNYYIKNTELYVPKDFTVEDVPNDGGEVLLLKWSYPLDKKVESFEVLKSKNNKKFAVISTKTANRTGKYSLRDRVKKNNKDYFYKIRVKRDGEFNTTKVIKAQSVSALFDMNKLPIFLAALILTISIVFFIRMARSGKELYIRRIAGLDAVDDAVGRATEMGREIMFVPGISDIDDPQTIAGLTILGRVAKLTAQYKTPLSVPVPRSMVMVTGREIVKEAYLSVGRPENFQDNMVYYLTDDQFGFAAGVDGIMVREKPATIFLQGSFFAESLILAETGHHIGAIQISGTAAPSQLPFFITACDYTLMGEELYAASAYLSREPQLLGSLRGQDVGKAIILVAIIIGIILETIATVNPDLAWLSIKKYFHIK